MAGGSTAADESDEGYVVKKTLFRLRFRDGRHEGAVIKVRGMSIDDLMTLNGAIPDLSLDGTMTPGMVREYPFLLDMLADFLVEWNLRDEESNVKIPATRAGLGSLEIPFSTEIVCAWLPASAGMSKELGKESSSGDTSPELSIPMEPPSPSPMS